jgi:hypothetical protein
MRHRDNDYCYNDSWVTYIYNNTVEHRELGTVEITDELVDTFIPQDHRPCCVISVDHSDDNDSVIVTYYTVEEDSESSNRTIKLDFEDLNFK